MYRTDDPIADYDRYDRERTKWLESKPKCSECGEHIQEDTAVHIYNVIIGDRWYCDDCLRNMRESTDLDDYNGYED